jgi:hypothetical protein
MVSEKDLNGQLIEKYAEAVNLERLAALANKSKSLSGLFLPGVTNAYLTNHRKVMIVGKETRGWGKKGLQEVKDFSNEASYIDHLIQRHTKLLQKPPRRSKFFQFYREANSVVRNNNYVATDAVAWANLFCLSYTSGTPAKSGPFTSC